MTIAIVRQKAFNGPNVWSRNPVTVFWLNIGGDPEVDLTPVASRLSGIIAEFASHETTYTPFEPFPINRPASFGELLAPFILNLQRLAGFPVSFWHCVSLQVDGKSQIVVEDRHETVGLAAARLAIRICNHIVSGSEPTIDIPTEFTRRFETIAGSRRYGRAAESIVAAAKARMIPISHLDPSAKLIELGTGAYRQRIHGSITSRTPDLGEAISRDKYLTNHYLRAAGLPVPRGSVVRRIDRAVEAAQEIGYPVVLKPIDQGGSTAVFVDLRSDEEIRDVFPAVAAASGSGSVLVEEYRTEDEYRVLIVNDRLISASLRLPAYVTGDGVNSIEKLVEIENRDPRRGKRESLPLAKIDIDADLLNYLARTDRSLGDIPPEGERIQLRLAADVNTGGFSIDKTNDVHPENVAIFRQATSTLGLDIASIDVVAHDISRSIWETSGAILDVNVGSGFTFERFPGEGNARDPGPAIIEMLYPTGSRVRAPILAVSGEFGVEICRLLAKIVNATGQCPSVVSSAGITINQARIQRGDARNPAGFGIALSNPATEVLVAEINPFVLTEQGLGFDYCDIAVLTSFSGIATPAGEPVERVFTSLCDPAGWLVVDADGAKFAGLMPEVGATMMIYSRFGMTDVVREFTAGGGTALIGEPTEESVSIALLSGGALMWTMSIDYPAVNAFEPARIQLGVVLPAMAAATALELPQEVVRRVILQHIGEETACQAASQPMA